MLMLGSRCHAIVPTEQKWMVLIIKSDAAFEHHKGPAQMQPNIEEKLQQK